MRIKFDIDFLSFTNKLCTASFVGIPNEWIRHSPIQKSWQFVSLSNMSGSYFSAKIVLIPNGASDAYFYPIHSSFRNDIECRFEFPSKFHSELLKYSNAKSAAQDCSSKRFVTYGKCNCFFTFYPLWASHLSAPTVQKYIRSKYAPKMKRTVNNFVEKCTQSWAFNLMQWN